MRIADNTGGTADIVRQLQNLFHAFGMGKYKRIWMLLLLLKHLFRRDSLMARTKSIVEYDIFFGNLLRNIPS